MVDQAKLCEVINRMAFLAGLAKNNADHEATDGVVKVKYGTQWMGIDKCNWPGCEGEAEMTTWEASRGQTTVNIPEMMFHFAKMNHWISFSEIPEVDQAKLIEIFK